MKKKTKKNFALKVKICEINSITQQHAVAI